MALLSELVATCAERGLDSEATLGVFARRLREAGRLSQAGRGRGAAHITHLDAARFLIACAATDHPERAVDAEFVFSNLMRTDRGILSGDFPLTVENAPTLDVALARVLEGLATGSLDALAHARWKEEFPADIPGSRSFPPIVWLRLPRGGAAASLRVLDGDYHYYHPSLAALVTSVNAHNPVAQQVAQEAFSRETYRFRTAKNLTAELDERLLRAIAQRVVAPRKGRQ